MSMVAANMHREFQIQGNKASLAQRLRSLMLADTPAVSAAERRQAALGALVGIGISMWLLEGLPAHSYWLLAPMGATAIILFGMATSPVAQPWPVAGGYLIACCAGLASASLVSSPWMAGAIAVAATLWLMARLNCVHPPGGALALLMVLDQKTFTPSTAHTIALVCANVALLLLSAAIINNLIPGRRYPWRAPTVELNPHGTQDKVPLQRGDLSRNDLDGAIRKLDGFVDVQEEQLLALYELAIDHAFSRHAGLTCGDAMSRDILTASTSTPLADAWQAMREHGIKALPVVDATRRLIGIITLSDFFGAMGKTGASAGDWNQWLRRPVADAMTSLVWTVRPETPMAELVREVAGNGRHHVPVIDADGKLVGMLTQSDMIAALYRRLALEPATS